MVGEPSGSGLVVSRGADQIRRLIVRKFGYRTADGDFTVETPGSILRKKHVLSSVGE